MKRKIFLTALLVAMGFWVTAGTASVQAAGEIVNGNASSLTGTAAQYGISTYEGLEVAMDEINAAGGVLGKKIVILKGDDSGDPRQAVNVVQKFITRDKVLVIIGPELTGTPVWRAP